jgi:hypothetical protein
MQRIFAWVNSDLDGIGSTILLGNIFKNFEYRHCFTDTHDGCKCRNQGALSNG